MKRFLVVLGGAVALNASAQTVTRVAGTTLTLSAGSRAGVKAGMTGKVCTTEVVSGQRVQRCPAEFWVDSVAVASATVTVIRGNAAQVHPGFDVKFNEKLTTDESEKKPVVAEKPKPTPAPKPKAPPRTASDVKAEADRLYDAKAWALAANRYSELVTKFPDDPFVEDAKALAEASSRKAAEEKARAEAERSEAERKRQAGELAAAQKEAESRPEPPKDQAAPKPGPN